MSAFAKVILIFTVLFTNQMFPQTINKVELRQDNPLQERIIPNSISDEQISHPLELDRGLNLPKLLQFYDISMTSFLENRSNFNTKVL